MCEYTILEDLLYGQAVLQRDWPERTRLSPVRVDTWIWKAKYLLTMLYFDGYGTEQNVEKAMTINQYFVGEASKKKEALSVTSKDYDRLTALRKELKDAHNKKYQKLLDKMMTDIKNNLPKKIE